LHAGTGRYDGGNVKESCRMERIVVLQRETVSVRSISSPDAEARETERVVQQVRKQLPPGVRLVVLPPGWNLWACSVEGGPDAPELVEGRGGL
jgi:hypothetical protein